MVMFMFMCMLKKWSYEYNLLIFDCFVRIRVEWSTNCQYRTNKRVQGIIHLLCCSCTYCTRNSNEKLGSINTLQRWFCRPMDCDKIQRWEKRQCNVAVNTSSPDTSPSQATNESISSSFRIGLCWVRILHWLVSIDLSMSAVRIGGTYERTGGRRLEQIVCMIRGGLRSGKISFLLAEVQGLESR